jgi:cytochrome P450
MRQGNRIEAEALVAAQHLTQTLLEQDGKSIDVVPVLQRCTLSLIYRYLTMTTPDSAVDSYLAAVIKIRMILLAQSRSIWFVLPLWCYKWLSPMYQHEEEVMKPIRAFASRALENAMPGSPLALLGLRTTTHGSSRDLLDEAVTLLFAGQDTGAATLAWTLHLLSLHPQVQDRLAEEVEDAHDFAKLPFLDAVLKESMRLYPVAPFFVRRLVQDVVTPHVTLPKNSFACIWVYSLHRNPAIWQTNP